MRKRSGLPLCLNCCNGSAHAERKEDRQPCKGGSCRCPDVMCTLKRPIKDTLPYLFEPITPERFEKLRLKLLEPVEGTS